MCQATEEEEALIEDFMHFLYECDAYANQQHILLKRTGPANFTLRNIMQETKYMKALAQYIITTRRF